MNSTLKVEPKEQGAVTRKAKVTRLHHITIRVKDFEKDVARWTATFGQGPWRIDDKAEWGYKLAFFKTGNVNIALLHDYGIKGINEAHQRVVKVSPPDSVGFFHMAFLTEDIDATVQEMNQAGIDLWDKEPLSEGYGGARYAWINPEETCHTLVHLYQADWGLWSD